MEILAHIVMAVWIPTVLVLFAVLGSRRAVIVTFLGAWLFLPMVTYRLAGLPDYTKMTATCAGIFIATVIFDSRRVMRFKPSVWDLPMLVFCLCPFIASQLNGLGAWDGTSAVISAVIIWGLPYLIGRLYFNDERSLRELAIAVVIGGLLYVPLCLFEVRMSPQLHNMIYGFFRREFQMRYGGWRPAVFMDGGLQVGMWMTAASLCGIWLWKSRALNRLAGAPLEFFLLPLLATTVLCRATGALVLLLLGLAAMWMLAATKSRWVLVVLLSIAPLYLCLRSTGVWNGEPLTTIAGWVDSDRAQSLQFRLNNEDILADKAMQQPIFGWGGWGRSRVYDQWGKDISITDGLWIIEFGQLGFVGLASCFMTMLVPLLLLVRRFNPRSLISPELAPALSLAILVCLYAIDCLPNAMINPVFTLAGGAVVSYCLASQRQHANVFDDSSLRIRKDSVAESVPPRRPYPGLV